MNGVVVTPEPSLPPLAKIESVSLKLSLWELLRGHVVITSGSLLHPELWLVINADGLSNFPKSQSATGDTLQYLAQSVTATNGSLRIDDQQTGLKIVLPQWDVRVAGNRLTNRHRIQFDTKAAGTATLAGQTYPVDNLHTVLDAGHHDLRIEKLDLRTPGATLSGTLSLLDFDQLGLKGDLVLDAQPAQFLPQSAGDIHAELAITGTAKAPLVNARVQAKNAAWQAYKNIDLNGNIAYDPQSNAITATQLTIASPFGNLNGDGRVSLTATGPSAFQGTVQRVPLTRLVPTLHSTASGTINAQWKGLEVTKASAIAAITLAGTRAPAKDVYPVAGSFRVERNATGDTLVHVDRAALSGVESTGTIHIDPRQQLSGQLAISTPNIAAQPYSKLPVSGGVKLNLNLSGTVQKPSAAFSFDAANLRTESVKEIAVAATGTVNADRLDLAQASAKWGGQVIDARGSIGLSGPSAPVSIQAEVRQANIPDLLQLLGQPATPITGVVNLNANFTGTLAHPLGTASLNVTNIEAYGERLGRLTATARFDANTATVNDLLLEKSPTEKLQGKGSYEFQSQRFTASLKSDPFHLTKGTVALQAEASGTPSHPIVNASLNGDLPEIGPIQIQADLDGPGLHATAQAPKQNAKAEARASTTAPYPFTLQINANETDLAALPQKRLEGKLTAQATAKGEAANWQNAEVIIHAEPLAFKLDNQPIQTAGPLSATLRNGVLELQPVTLNGPGTRLTVEGKVPGALQVNGAVNLASALPSASGELTLAGVIDSTLTAGRYSLAPRLDLSLNNAAYAHPDLPPLTAASARAHLADGSLQLESLSALWAGATITGTAELPLGLLSASLPFDLLRKLGPANANLSVKNLDFAQFKGMPETAGGQASFQLAVEAARPELEALRGELRFDALHQGRELRFEGTLEHQGALTDFDWARHEAVLLLQHPGHHGVGHDREAGHEVHVAATEARNLVVRVRDDARTFREHAHVQAVHVVGAVRLEGHALLARHVLHALLDEQARLRVQHQRHVQRRRRALPGVVVGRGADAAEGEDEVAAAEGVAQCLRDQAPVVAHVACPGQRHPARAEQLDGLGQVPVATLAREDLVADDDHADVHEGCSGWGSGTGACVAVWRAVASRSRARRASVKWANHNAAKANISV
jgi:hypothetical protein